METIVIKVCSDDHGKDDKNKPWVYCPWCGEQIKNSAVLGPLWHQPGYITPSNGHITAGNEW